MPPNDDLYVRLNIDAIVSVEVSMIVENRPDSQCADIWGRAGLL